ncbi:MAG: ABC transporter substrate-binding protein [Lachnospiraceae bacterium]|nr:ABC transporter substrate-binding protein [Lachnospiraceae bacterium]
MMKKAKIWLLAAAGMVLTGAALNVSAEKSAIRVGALKGPTSMGLVSLMERSKEGDTGNSYEFEMVTAADELLAQVVSEKVDIALIPANTASVLYNKTEGNIRVLDINTLGVLYMLESGGTIQSVSDLEGKTVYLTGKGTTPDYVLQYLLRENGLSADAVRLEYKSEATEVVSALAADEAAIGLLPQPFVTVALGQNEKLRIALDLTEEWDKLQTEGGSSLVTGVTITRADFLEKNEEAVRQFLTEHEASSDFTNENLEEAAELIAELGIVQQPAIAQKAIPYCNITCVQGEEMKEALEGYLEVLYGLDSATVGGALPSEDFYYIP